MPPSTIFTHTDPKLLPVLEQLRLREPIFHTREFGTSGSDYERATAPSYWEVGASGRRYSREFILGRLRETSPEHAERAGWQSWDHALRELGPGTYLLTYVLRQGERLSRRATVWRSSADGWQILYHQGTLVLAEEDDVAP